ncbi:MAG: DeoR/GlpR family DNA-binding transcription regulator [bacterium]
MIHNLNTREQAILDILMDGRSSSVADISRELNVSQVTTRTLLSSLADRGLIVRTWGGAIPALAPEILNSSRTREEEKRRIARAAADLIGDNDTVMIEAGTTTALVASYMLGRRATVVTNSMLVVPYARANPAMRLTVVGGEFRSSTESMVGPLALSQLSSFHVKIAIVGTDGFSLDYGLSTHLPEGAEIVKAMARQAEHTVLVADSSKWNSKGFVSVLPLEAVDTIVSDTELEPLLTDEDRESFESKQVTLVFA